MRNLEKEAEGYLQLVAHENTGYTDKQIKNAFTCGSLQEIVRCQLLPDERKIIEDLRAISDSFMRLPELDAGHADRTAFVIKIRELQSLVMQREAVRNNPDIFTIGKFGGLTDDWDDKENK
jgi:hypothetical protein